ncbi:DciA family protein [Phycisphaeraceae bacterium D3-23]
MMFGMNPEQAQKQLDTLRPSRSLPRRDLSLGFMNEQFKQDVAKPYKQLGDLSALWRELMPPHLVARTRLIGLSRGVLHIEADSSAAHYEIDQLLRGGAKRELITRHKGPAIKKVQVKVGVRKDTTPIDPRRQPLVQDMDGKVSPEVQPPRGRVQGD